MTVEIWAKLQRVERSVREPTGYAAFISYSHAADGRLAPAVQQGLERLAKPWYRRRALRIFRDDSGLAVTPALWTDITTALDHSEYLVVLAAPEAAQSEWVNREIEHWKMTKSVNRILLVITDGECHWDSVRGDFDPDRSTALPLTLLGMFSEEPLWLDLKWARSETQLDLRHSRFRNAIAQLAAPIHHRAKDDLESEDIRLHRRALRLAQSAVATLIGLALVALAGWNNAVSNERLARAGELAARATANIDQQPLSLLLSLESLRLTPTDEGRESLLRALLEGHHSRLALRGHDGPVVGVAFSPDGKMIASVSADQKLRRWDTTTGQQIGQPLTGHTGVVKGVAFSPDGKKVASASWDKTVRLWDTVTGAPIGQPLTGHTNEVNSVAFSPDGKMLVSTSYDTTLRRWDVTTGQQIGQPLIGHTDTVNSAAFSPDGRIIASTSAGADRSVRLWNSTTGQQIGQPLTGHTGAVNGVAFSPDGGMIVSGSDDRSVRLWNATTGQQIGQRMTGHNGVVNGVTFSPTGKTHT